MRIRLLGPLAVFADGRPLALGGFKQRTVLAMLALQSNCFQSVDQLTEDLWPDDQPGRPRKTLQVYVANLRRELGADRIEYGPGGYRLRVASSELDLTDFRDLADSARRLRSAQPLAALTYLEQALALRTGPILGDLSANHAVATLVRPLNDLHLAVTEDLFRIRLETGSAQLTIGALQALVDLQPFRESAWALLMEAYYRSGRQADALDAYARVVRLLDDELGVEPGPELRSLHVAILRHELQPISIELASPPPAEERRTVTVAVLGEHDPSGALDDLDPEDLAERSQRLHGAVMEAAARHGGRVIQVNDNAVTAVFGHPQASEMDPDQAVLAALTIVRQCGCSAGVSTGLVFVDRQSGLLTGATGRAASLLQSQATPGRVLVTAATAELLVGRFRLEPVEVEPTKDDAASHDTSASLMAVLGEVEHLLVPRALVGRATDEAKLAMYLGDRMSAVVLVHGEAGIGKSALVAHALTALRPETVTTVLLRGRWQDQAQSFRPFTIPLRKRHSSVAGCEADLRLLGVGVPKAQSTASRLAELAGWPAEGGPYTQDGSEPPLREALVTWLTALGSARPLWFVVEDLHAVDGETLDLIARLPNEVGRLVLLMTSRGDSVPPGLETSSARIKLERLPQAAARSLVLREALPRRLRLSAVNEILELGGGHPLHLKVLVGHSEDQTSGHVVPLALDGGLRAVLDRLGPLRELAQRCAVLGPHFDLATASLVAGDADEAHLRFRLGKLVDAGVLTVDTGTGFESINYEFSHELLEQVAYHSLPRRLRRELHRTLADNLERSGRLPDGERARHLEHAGDPRAASTWLAAGTVAVEHGRHAEAASSLRRALTLLPAQPSRSRDQLELMATLSLIRALNLTTTYSTELEHAVGRAHELAVLLGRSDLDAYPVLCRIGLMQAAGRYVEAAQAALDAIALAEQTDNPGLKILAHQYYASTLALMGCIREAHDHLRPVSVPLEVAARLNAHERFSVCAGLATAAFHAFVEGGRQQSADWLNQALHLARGCADPVAESVAHLLGAMTDQLDSRAAQIRVRLEPVLDHALTSGNDWFYTWAQSLLGWSHAVEHEPAEGLTMIVEALAHSSTHYFETYFLLLAAQAERLDDQPRSAIRRIDDALALAEQRRERLYMPYLQRERAASLDALGEPAEAAVWRTSARTLALSQGNVHAANLPLPDLTDPYT